MRDTTKAAIVERPLMASPLPPHLSGQSVGTPAGVVGDSSYAEAHPTWLNPQVNTASGDHGAVRYGVNSIKYAERGARVVDVDLRIPTPADVCGRRLCRRLEPRRVYLPGEELQLFSGGSVFCLGVFWGCVLDAGGLWGAASLKLQWAAIS